jgi:hypothetical protein
MEHHKQGPQESLVEDNREDSRVTRPVPFGGLAPAPHKEGGNQNQRQDAYYAVQKFDHGLHFWRSRQDPAIAQGPVVAATGAGSSGPHIRAPNDHPNVVSKG